MPVDPVSGAFPATGPVLPMSWRPRRTRLVAYALAGVVLATMAVIAVALPTAGLGAFGLTDRVALVGLGAAVAAFLHLLARVRLVADEDGLTVVNLFRTHRLSWAEVVQVNLRHDDPWVLLDLDDGNTLAAMGIQASDGDRARAAVVALRAALVAHSRTDRDD